MDFFLISYIALITSFSLSVWFRNLAQLVACTIAGRLGGDLDLIKECGAKLKLTDCGIPLKRCVWALPITSVLTKFGGVGWCVPAKLVSDPDVLVQGFTVYSSLVVDNLPAYSVVIECLKIPNIDCNKNGCGLCGDALETNYLVDYQLTNLCVPTALKTAFCNDFKETTHVTLCSQEVARRLIPPAGCNANCAYGPR